MTHSHCALARLAHDRKALGQQIVQALSLGCAFAQDIHPLAQLGVALQFQLGLVCADQRDALLVLLELLGLTYVERTIEDRQALRVSTTRFPGDAQRTRRREPRDDGDACRDGA